MDTAKQLSWLDCDLSFSREKKSASSTINYVVPTDFQLKLELPRVINGDDKLRGK